MGWMNFWHLSSVRGVLVMEPTTWTLLVAGKKPQWRQITVDEHADFSHNWSQLNDTNLRITHLTLVVPNHLVIFDDCDPPTLSTAEWKQSLPFLLMDQVSMDVTDMVIFPWQTLSSQWQVAVMKRSQLQSWCSTLSEKKIQLERVIPSALGWGVGEKETSGVVLQDQQGWHLLIYCDDVLCFQRRLRGIDAQSDVSTTLLQLRAELQRTLTFLRGTPQYPEPIRWRSACQSMDADQVCSILHSVFGVPCSVFSAFPDWSLSMSLGWQLLQADEFSHGFSAEAWQAPTNRFSRTLIATLVGGIFSFSMCGFAYYQTALLADDVAQQTVINDQLIARLKSQLVSPEQQKLTQQRALFSQKERDWRSLETLEKLNQQGFSAWLQAFGASMTGEIQLTSFTLKGDFVELKGNAKNSAAVPHWIAKFAKFPILATPQFDSLHVTRDPEDRLTFVLRSVERSS